MTCWWTKWRITNNRACIDNKAGSNVAPGERYPLQDLISAARATSSKDWTICECFRLLLFKSPSKWGCTFLPTVWEMPKTGKKRSRKQEKGNLWGSTRAYIDQEVTTSNGDRPSFATTLVSPVRRVRLCLCFQFSPPLALPVSFFHWFCSSTSIALLLKVGTLITSR